ncbi:hypothetical protein [Pseudomonas sp. H9]|uniref:hypothetical protein n=1 Tax=Pseudomonas sp. H9 TaxID=483968 RepID=UPI0010579B1E|nr:hypothetical protein [Pseudomonas sp. H9]TDF81788.1 hypothetical protein E1573_16870 [Pseudomonas sp. H9]
MADPFDKATSKAPPVLGEGCLSRFDPEALSNDDGTDFPGAVALWEQLHPPGAVPEPDSTAGQPG